MNNDKMGSVFLKIIDQFFDKTDLIICYATATGNYAIRDRSGSSPFIQAFCNEINRKKRQNIFQENHQSLRNVLMSTLLK